MDINKQKQKLQKQLQLWQLEKQIIIQRQDLQKDIKQTKNRYKGQRKKLSTSKFLMLFLFISCSAVEFFTIFLTFKSLSLGYVDFSALQSLITAVVAEVVGFAIYALKSTKENTKGGIVYQTAMIEAQQCNQTDQNNQEAVG